MTAKVIKLKSLKIFGCPECKKRFANIMAVNVHLAKVHEANYKIYLSSKGRAYVRATLILNVA